MIDLLLLGALVWAAARVRRVEANDLGSVPPRAYPEGGRYWYRGVECYETRDPWHMERVLEARRVLETAEAETWVSRPARTW